MADLCFESKKKVYRPGSKLYAVERLISRRKRGDVSTGIVLIFRMRQQNHIIRFKTLFVQFYFSAFYNVVKFNRNNAKY